MAVLSSGSFPHLVLVGPAVDDDITTEMSLASVTPALSVGLTPPGGQRWNDWDNRQNVSSVRWTSVRWTSVCVHGVCVRVCVFRPVLQRVCTDTHRLRDLPQFPQVF